MRLLPGAWFACCKPKILKLGRSMVIEETSLPQFIICYASQKGNANAIAEEIFDQCISLKLSGCLSCVSEIKSLDELKVYSCTIFVGSTTGDGDPPDTAIKFMRELRKQSLQKQRLVWFHYTVLGLGDTNYTNFCNFGKTLHLQLQNLGAKCFYENGWADDGTGLEVVVEPWIDGLFPVLEKFLRSARPCSPNCDKIISATDDIRSDTSLLPVSDISLYDLKMAVDLCSQFPSLNLPSSKELDDSKVKKLKFEVSEKLTLPIIPSSYLVASFSEQSLAEIDSDVTHGVSYPSAATDVFSASIIRCQKLTKEGSFKKTLEISLCIEPSEKVSYEPGDSFGIIVHNSAVEVSLLLHLLNLQDKADSSCKFSIDPSSKKKAILNPYFIGKKCTLRQIFTEYVDFRQIPKKPFLRALCEYTQNDLEKRRLQEFVSKEGSDEYNEIVRYGGLTFLDMLISFRFCQPPVTLVLEHLPRLLPRPYSVTSSPLEQPNVISFAFNIIEICKENSITFARKGICTGWLDELTKDRQNEEVISLEDKLKDLSLDKKEFSNIFMYFRSNCNFRLPKEINTPYIMVGPGTGIAPFIGFLKHRNSQVESNDIGYSWLFFGCRHKNKDFLYQNEIESLVESKVLSKFSVCFSRDEGEQATSCPKYVQDNIVAHGEALVDLINSKNATIYVCGDAKNMSKNVFDAFQQIVQNNLKLDEVDARKVLAQMQIDNRYLQDVWT